MQPFDTNHDLRHLIDGLDAIIWEMDAATGQYTFVSQAAERILGFPIERWYRDPGFWATRIHSDDHDRLENYCRTAITKGPGYCTEYRALTADGREVWLRESVRVVRGTDESVPQLRGVTTDVTEERGAEEARARLAAIMEATTDLVSIADPQGRVLYLNKAGREMLGVREDEDISETRIGAYHPCWAADAVLDQGLPTAIREGVWRGEGAVLRRDGREIPVSQVIRAYKSPTGGLKYFSTVARDITERKLAEEETKKMAAFPQFNPNPVLELGADGTISFLNAAARQMADSLGQGKPTAILPPDLISFAKGTWATAENKCHREITLGGRTLSWSSFVIKERRMVHCYGEDITERKQLEDQFRQSQKMEAVGKLAGGVAHDFNNLLTIITGYAELLLDRFGTIHPVRGYAEEIKKAGDCGASLTRQLLAFSRRQVLQPQVLDLNVVVKDMYNMLRRLIGEHVDLVTVPEPALSPVKADLGQIEQVILNLTVNARDAMPQGGKLTIETANVELDESYARSHYPTQPGHYVMLAVSDTGVGMDKQTQARVFEPFFTTKELGKGTGLGLSTVYGIVKQSGGYIWVYSEPGRGATFKIYLPRANGAGEAIGASQPTAKTRYGSETVLLVEDEEAVRSIVRTTLHSNGYKVLEASRGEEALLIGEQYKGPIGLLLTDVVIPGISGRELAERLAPLRPEMKVLYMSGYPDDAFARNGVLNCNVSFLQKPFKPNVLALKVREVLDVQA